MTRLPGQLSRAGPDNGGRRGFSIVELMVVIAIAGVLMAMLMPALAKARRAAQTTMCASNMRSVGQAMSIYAQGNGGWLFPPRVGINVPGKDRWPVKVFNMRNVPEEPQADMALFVPAILFCPADSRDVLLTPDRSGFMADGQRNAHSYVVSLNLGNDDITYSKRAPQGSTPSTFAIMAEKLSSSPAYYVGTRANDPSAYTTVLSFYRHLAVGSNYLFLDLHVAPLREDGALRALDPAGFPVAEPGQSVYPRQ